MLALNRKQEEFLSVVSRKESSKAEEEERVRRINEELQKERLSSEMNRRLTFLMEEEERRRRIVDDLKQDHIDALESQLNRYIELDK